VNVVHIFENTTIVWPDFPLVQFDKRNRDKNERERERERESEELK